MQIPIMQGIYTDTGTDIRVAYPVNMVPIPVDSGVSAGYLRPADGIEQFATVAGIDRGGIEWNGACYRVVGTTLIRVDNLGNVNTIGTIDGADYVSMTYSFDRLAIAGGGYLYYFDGSSLTRVTDADLGTVLDVIWVDGYFMTTDGENLVVTELTDPTQVNPLKYGSSEIDPDPVVGLVKVRNEVYAVNRNTIEVFDNVGGDFFPFNRIDGAQISKGAVGTHAACMYMEAVAFVGSGRNESISVYIGANSNAEKISTQEIDTVLAQYSEATLSGIKVESVIDRSNQYLMIHLPDRTLVFDGGATKAIGVPVWFTLTSAVQGFSRYRAQNFVYAYGRWIVGDPLSARLGVMTKAVGSHYGEQVRWEFATAIVYNESRGAIMHKLELVALTGRVELGAQPTISTSYSLDGSNWSQERTINAGTIGDRLKRLVWWKCGSMRNMRIQRFRGDSDAHVSVARLEAEVEGLAN